MNDTTTAAAPVHAPAPAPTYTLWRFKKVPEPVVVLVAAVVGLVVQPLMARA